MGPVYGEILQTVQNRGGREKQREKEKKCPLNFHCFESRQFNESYILDPCFVYTFSFQNTKNTLFGRLVIFSLYINSAHSLLPRENSFLQIGPQHHPRRVELFTWLCFDKTKWETLSHFFFEVSNCTTDHPGVSQDNLTQPGMAWERSQHERLARSSWPVSVFVRDCLNCCGMIQPTEGSAIP